MQLTRGEERGRGAGRSEPPRLDWSRSFLPTSLVGVSQTQVLWDFEQRKLSQIGARGYFRLVSGFELALARVADADDLVRSNAQALEGVLADVERFIRAFDAAFEVECAEVRSFASVEAAFRGASPLALQIAALHLGTVARHHALEELRGAEPIDTEAERIFCGHWDASAGVGHWRTKALARCLADAAPGALALAWAECRQGLRAAANTMRAQCNYDLKTLENAIGRSLLVTEREAVARAYRGARRRALLAQGPRPGV